MNGQWLLIRDFNRTLKEGERHTASGISSNFAGWTKEMGLINLGFTSAKFT